MSMQEPFKLASGRAPEPAKVRETDITAQIRELLRRLRIPHWKNWGGPLGERGVPDLIGSLPPSGRLLLIEVKKPDGRTSPEQDAFLERYSAAGAVAFVARGSMEVLKMLAQEGYAPAVSALTQFGIPGLVAE